MKFLVLLAVSVCVSMKIDAFPQQDPIQISESQSNTDSNVPKVASTEPIKAVEDKTGEQRASPVEQKETPSIKTDALKQNNGKTSSVEPVPKAENATDVSIKPKEGNLPEVKNVDDVSKNCSTTEKTSVKNIDDSFGNGAEPENDGEAVGSAVPASAEVVGDSGPDSSEMVGDGPEPWSSGTDKDSSTSVSGSHGYSNVKDLIQRINERIRALMQQMRNTMENEELNEMSSEDGKSDESRSINFPSFSDELQ